MHLVAAVTHVPCIGYQFDLGNNWVAVELAEKSVQAAEVI